MSPLFNDQPLSICIDRSEPFMPTQSPLPVSKGGRKVSQTAAMIANIGATIAGQSPSSNDMAFMHTYMCQLGLPRSHVDGTKFERRSGEASLMVEAGSLWNGKEYIQQPIPYGAMPRLMLAWMNTYAVRNNSPEIPIGDSASEFLRMLGKASNGGKRGAFANFRKQLQALSACTLSLGFNDNGRAHTYGSKPIKHFEAWIAVEGRPIWPGTVTFSEEYFQTLKGHAVPLDLRAYTALKGSSLAMDAYLWLTERLHRISGDDPVFVSWANLLAQFGQEYEGKDPAKDFKKRFLAACRAAKAVYPKAKVTEAQGGLLLYRSPPPVPPKP